MWLIGLPFTRKRHIFAGIFWKWHRVNNTCKWWKRNIFQRFQNETKQSLRCTYTSLVSNFLRDCTEFVTVEFAIVFKLLWYQTPAQILLPSHFSPFSKCAGISRVTAKYLKFFEATQFKEIGLTTSHLDLCLITPCFPAFFDLVISFGQMRLLILLLKSGLLFQNGLNKREFSYTQQKSLQNLVQRAWTLKSKL